MNLMKFDSTNYYLCLILQEKNSKEIEIHEK